MCVSLLSQPASACVVTGQGMGAGPGCHCHVSHTLSFLSPCPLWYSTSLALLIYPSSVFFAHSGKLTTYKGGYISNKTCPPFRFIKITPTVIFNSDSVKKKRTENMSVYVCYNMSDVCA